MNAVFQRFIYVYIYIFVIAIIFRVIRRRFYADSIRRSRPLRMILRKIPHLAVVHHAPLLNQSSLQSQRKGHPQLVIGENGKL